MPRLTVEGSFYFHAIICLFGLIIIILFKDFNFSKPEIPPALSSTQHLLIKLFFIIGLFVLLLFVVRGLTIKQPRLGATGIVALIFMVLGLEFIVGGYYFDYLIGRPKLVLGSYSVITMGIGCLLVILGSMIFAYRKFSEDVQYRWFITAVKDALERSTVSEETTIWRELTSSRIIYRCPRCKAEVSATVNKCPNCKAEFEPIK